MNASCGNEYNSVISYLKQMGLHFIDSWVIECVNYYKSTNNNFNLDQLKKVAYQQWLLLDLKDIKVPCFPSNLSAEKVLLKGKYAVQVETMIDVGRSFYSQIQKVRNVNITNIELTEVKSTSWEPQPSRCLLLTLTDGVQEIKAMEYKPIPSLRIQDLDMLPGFKMVITGPVVCRKGMLLLTNQNVQVLGGEVDSLVTCNAVENILARKLGLEENPNPLMCLVQPNANVLNQSDNNFSAAENTNSENQGINRNQHIDDFSINPDDFLDSDMDFECVPNTAYRPLNENDQKCLHKEEKKTLTSFNTQNNTSCPSHLLQHKAMNHSKFVECKTNNETFRKSECNNKSFNLKPYFNQRVFSENNMLSSTHSNTNLSTAVEKRNKLSETIATIRKPVQSTLNNFFFVDNKCKSVPETPHSSSSSCSSTFKQSRVSHEPFVYLKQISELKISEYRQFVVKAEILTIKTKLSLHNEEFFLKANISDGSLSMDVKFASRVLEQLLGFSACEMEFMIKEESKNPAISHRIKNAFQSAQQKLITLNCLFKIEFLPQDNIPTVFEIKEITEHHFLQLKDRQLS